jgi:hypothetical protein
MQGFVETLSRAAAKSNTHLGLALTASRGSRGPGR